MADLRALVDAVREARSDVAVAAIFLAPSQRPTAHHAEAALCDYLLTHPEAVEAVEVLMAYGVARAADDWGYDVDAEWMRVAELADRLTANGDDK